jgi:hypothetical protein
MRKISQMIMFLIVTVRITRLIYFIAPPFYPPFNKGNVILFLLHLNRRYKNSLNFSELMSDFF